MMGATVGLGFTAIRGCAPASLANPRALARATTPRSHNFFLDMTDLL